MELANNYYTGMQTQKPVAAAPVTTGPGIRASGSTNVSSSVGASGSLEVDGGHPAGWLLVIVGLAFWLLHAGD